ncbi:MAG TPA: carboxypeptidase regulatory-like domain-containing protein [Candidatus Eremiobacteraceae bacterium]|nr:carboxypeptidase regulatory-like domain-containing protein [Candidatus Eremiobacteraceae bacterium]
MTYRSTALSAGHVTAIARNALFVLALSLMSVCTMAQSTAGRVLGTITDQSGASVAGATVVVTDTQRGTSRSLTTGASGDYAAPDLTPGIYKIRVEARGFKSEERPSITVEVATDVRADFALQPGNVSEVVTVSGDVPLLNTTSATLGGTLSNQEINDLPLNGRNYENLLQLRPGVIRYPGGGFSTTSADGLRAEDNAYFVEGLFNSEPYSGQAIINGAGIAGDSATILPIDAIQEFNLQQNPPAEYGWKPGAVVNVGLKSGTNRVHGTAFGFGRDGALDGRNYFNDDPNPKLTRTLEQFGGSLGGPIIKDKAFFFAAYEGQRYNVGNSFGGITSPSMVHMSPNGTCSFGFAGDCADSIPDAIADITEPAAKAAGVIVSPTSLLISGCSFSGAAVACNGSGFPTNTAQSINITNGFNNVVHVNNVVAKVDYKFTERSSISGTYFFGNNTGTVEDFPELQQKWLSDIHTRAQVVGGNWIWTPTSRLVNEARFGYNRLYQPTLPGDLNTPASAYGLDTGVSGPETGGLPRIGFGGYFFPGLGGFKWPKFQGPDSITQFVDHISYTAGKHALKFGGELHYDKVNNAAYGNARGSINFLGGVVSPNPGPAGSAPLEDFFAGAPFKSTVEVGNPTLQLHNWAYALFFQDDFRATRNLTLNFGVRYEFSSVPQEAHNLLGNFEPTVGLVQVGHQISSLWNPDHTNFGPRAGFAWDIGGNGRTVLRGGGGLIYETVNWQSFVAFNNAFGPGSVPTGAPIDAAGDTSGGTITTSNVTVKNFLSYPTTWDAANGPLYGGSTVNCSPVLPSGNPGSPCPIMTVDRGLTTPYVWNWTLNVQHSFTPNLSIEAAYVGNHGSNLTGIRDINQPPVGSGWTPAGVGAGTLAACLASAPNYNSTTCAVDTGNEVASEPFNAKFPYLANIFQMSNVYRSNYDGLQVTLNARNYHGLSMVAGYTYSHALDDVGANWDFGYGSGLPQNAHNPGAEYANSDFDIRHRLTVSLTYAIPGRKGFGQLREGWEVNSIITLESPQYWGPMDEGTDAAGIGPLPVSPPAQSPIRWSFYGKTSDFKSQKGVGIPYFSGASNPACVAQAAAVDGGTAGRSTASLNLFGCYANGSSVMIPPPLGEFGNMSRNMFEDTGFRNFDFSVAKNFHFGETMRLQGRVEFFNIFNHPNFANPYGGQNGFGLNDPSVRPFGCGCATPDVAAANPAVGSGGPRSIQLGLKFIF